jgi:hypothetical protein
MTFPLDDLDFENDAVPARVSSLETPELRAALAYALKHDTYLVAEEAAAYVRCASLNAFYHWRKAHDVPAYGSRGKLLFRRRDLDEALKPRELRGRRPSFGGIVARRGPR